MPDLRPKSWDSRKEKEIRQALDELHALDETGYFAGLPELVPGMRIPSAPAENPAAKTRATLLTRKVSQLRPMDNPVGPALSQFMTQLRVQDRTNEYKSDTQKKFTDAVGQVRILFGKILRGEVGSNALIRSVVGSFLDTFMRDRNLLVNLAAAPCVGPDYIYDHSLKLCLLSLSIASAAGYNRSQAIEIAQGALLADVGMLLVPESIRHKHGKLTDGEVIEMRKHPIHAMGLLEPIHGLSEPVLVIPYQHHERVSGTGYPDKRSGSLVSKFSRIVSVADVFSALINKRSYRDALLPYQAMVAILGMGGQGWLDGEPIKQFMRTASIFPLGSLVRLSSGKVAKVVAPNPKEFTKPTVSILTEEDGSPLAKERIHQVDLMSGKETIVEALPGHTIPNHILDGF